MKLTIKPLLTATAILGLVIGQIANAGTDLLMTCVPDFKHETIEGITSVSLVKSKDAGKIIIQSIIKNQAAPSIKIIDETDFTQKEKMIVLGEMEGVGHVVILTKIECTQQWRLALYWFCSRYHCEERDVMNDTFMFMRSMPMTCT